MKKTILLTGATDGIGFETAKVLAKEGHTLLLHGRSPEKLERVKKAVLDIDSNLDVRLFTADFSHLEGVRRVTKEIAESVTHLDILINNAGLCVAKEGEEFSAEGIDVRFVINTIAPYLLTRGLLSRMDKDGRVVNLASRAQVEIDYDAMKNKTVLPYREVYGQSKLALIMWTMELAKTEAPLLVSINPKSFLASKMVKEAFDKDGFDLGIGVDIICRAAFSDEFANANGAYYDNDEECFADPNPYAMKEENRKKFMEYLSTFE